MTLVDTSALFGLADTGDTNHFAARRILAALQRRQEPLLTHNYVLVEAMALFARRLGRGAIAALLAEAAQLEVVWVDPPLHRAALEDYEARAYPGNFVDQMSFSVMRSRGITDAFAFDRDFVAAGFRLCVP